MIDFEITPNKVLCAINQFLYFDQETPESVFNETQNFTATVAKNNETSAGAVVRLPVIILREASELYLLSTPPYLLSKSDQLIECTEAVFGKKQKRAWANNQDNRVLGQFADENKPVRPNWNERFVIVSSSHSRMYYF